MPGYGGRVPSLRPDRHMTKPGKLEDPSIQDADAVVRALGTDLERGLTSDEASHRLAEEGPNELRSAPPIPVWRRVLAQGASLVRSRF